MNTIVQFHTNIDCMKKYMRCISGMPLNPNIGDNVRVYSDSDIVVELQVVERKWTFTNGANPILHCELHLTKDWLGGLGGFIQTMKGYNIV